MRATSRLTALLIGLALAATACGGGATTDSGPDTAADSEAASSSSSGSASGSDTSTEAGGEPAAGSVTISHAMGEATVECAPERVVTLGQGPTDTTLALGVTPVGVVETWTGEWYEYLPAEVTEATVVGSEIEPDLELIASLQPDVILGSKLRHEAFHEQLSQIAPTVFSETIGVAWKDNVPLWGDALCLQDEADDLLADWDQRTSDLQAGLQDAGKADTEVSMIRFLPDEVRIYLTGFPGSVLRDAGLQRPAAQVVDDWENSEQLIGISEERIPDMDGDVIFVMTSDYEAAQESGYDLDETVTQWTSSDLWQGLSAVRADEVHQVNEDHWNLGGGILAANAMLDDLEAHFLGGEQQ